MTVAPLGLVVLISGRGSNMVALARAGLSGRIPARVTAVISDRANAEGLDRARELGIPATVVPPASHRGRAAYGEALAAAVDAAAPGLVALAGFMRILDGGFVRRYEGRMFNVHPSLLPAYPGLHTHRRVLEAGDAVHGCTVHFVTEELDAGPGVIQARVPVLPAFSAGSALGAQHLPRGRRLVRRGQAPLAARRRVARRPEAPAAGAAR